MRENSEYAKSACISTVFPFGALAPDGRESGHQWHSRGQRFDPAYLHHRKSHRKPFGLRCFSLFYGKFQIFYAKMIFPQMVKIRFCQQKVSTNRFLTTKNAWKNRPADNWTAFFLLDYEFCSIHSATSSSDKSKRIPLTTPFERMSMIINPH